MSGYIKHFDNGRKSMSFLVEDIILVKYNKIWNKNKKTLHIKFHIKPVYDEKY